MFDSNPAASSAHIVVNIASLPSTLTAVGAAACVRERATGVCGGAGVGAADCPAADDAITAHNPNRAIDRCSILIPFAAVLFRASRCLDLRMWWFSAWKGISGSGVCPVTMLRHNVNLPSPSSPVKESRSLFLSAAWCNACLFCWHLLTVKMRPRHTRDGSLRCFSPS